ncbi:hypothetical protein [Candidatus Magnetominusculus dajiuhuensis]|uniref:hypothetical protein n=1 Tax=Candidatus Magnetominusculus dajiuhuensis TaxID=3137712 RepID=UPI003B433896
MDIEDYKLEDLPNEDLRLVAENCGLETAIKLLTFMPGRTIHVLVTSDGAKPGDLLLLWNEYAAKAGLCFANKMTAPRMRNCRARLKERRLDEWEEVFKKIIANPFLTGKNKDGWRASFDWIIKNDNNSQKVLDGFYDRKKAGHATGSAYDKYRK